MRKILALALATFAYSPAASADVAHGNHFVINATVGACAVGAECKIDLRLEAQGDYHVNKEYPYKFRAADSAGVEFLGKDPTSKNMFSKAAGDFSFDAANEKIGTMTVRLKPGIKGNAVITGTFKLSVCSAEECALEQTDLSVPIAVR